MKKYLLLFTAVYAIAMLILGIIFTLLNLGGSTSISILFAAGATTAYQFVKQEKRLPTPAEKQQLIWGSIAATFIVSSLAFLCCLIIFEDFREILTLFYSLPAWVWLIAIAFTILIEYMVLALCYNFFAKQCLKQT